MTDNAITHLKELKRKIQHQEVSVLVGAGFSKNVSSLFPSWHELLHDMAFELYKDEIEEVLAKRESTTSKPIDKALFIKERIRDYIDQVGYLDIVSQYIKRKGHREAISTYIEENTPKLIRKNKKTYLSKSPRGETTELELKEEMLSLHRLILQLPWNNIYTTNYDEMLETANDATTAKRILEEISKVKREIDDYLNKESTVQQEIKRLMEMNFERLRDQSKELESEQDFQKDLAEAKNEEEIAIKRAESRRIEDRLRNLEAELSTLQKAYSDCLALVKHSSQLSIKRNRNIIKLHGSLRGPKGKYGFDGDIRKQYVIAKEDYDTYPSKHEAFTQLMRISLLQESYCLIGFSGADPNFMEWIKWVRDVIERDVNERGPNFYKIYLIDVAFNEPTPEKKLFYENHRVCRVPIMDGPLIDFMEGKGNGEKVDRKDRRKVLELLLRYLTDDINFNNSRATYEVIQLRNYRNLWDSISVPLIKRIDIKDIASKSRNVIRLKKYNRIASLHIGYIFKKSLLFRTEELLTEAKGDKRVSRQLMDLVIVALKDTFLVPSLLWPNKSFQTIYAITKEYPLQWSKLNELYLREAVLNLDKELFDKLVLVPSKKKEDWLIYEKILFAAFSFDFTSLRHFLNEWSPRKHWILKKAGMLGLFDNKAAVKLLSDHANFSEVELIQEELYRLQILSYVSHDASITSHKELRERIHKYKEARLKDLYENFDRILSDLNKEKERFERYGDRRYSISENSRVLSIDFTVPQKGVQFIQLLIETGIPLSLPSVYWKSPKSWYPVFQRIFEYVPFPALFYSLQYSDEKFLRKIGQDYAFSDKLIGQHQQILINLLKAYLNKDTPKHYKRSILSFCAELFNVVPPELWEDWFKKIWTDSEFNQNVFAEFPGPEESFASGALPFLKSNEVIRGVIMDSIKDQEWKSGLEILFHLAKNNHLNEIGSKIQDTEVAEGLKGLINGLQQEEKILFKLGNLVAILTDEQKETIRDILITKGFDDFDDKRIWEVLLFFSNKYKPLIDKVKEGVVSSKRLWDAGFTTNGLSSGNPFIRLSRLEESPNRPTGITWSETDSQKIYKRLKQTLRRIEQWLERRTDHSFLFIFQEMDHFLIREESNLKGLEDYQLIRGSVKELYNKDRGYESLIDGLLAPDRSRVVWALSDLSYEWEDDSELDRHSKTISLILNKILLQAEPAIEACLEFIAYWVEDEQIKVVFAQHTDTFLLILKKYFDAPPLDSDIPFIHKQLIGIARQLSKVGIEDRIIDQWLEYQKSARFNDVQAL